MNELTHIGVIIDGNRRFAKNKKLLPWKGHQYGAETVEKTIEWCQDLGIKELTFYALSMDNLKRDKKEVDELLDLMRRWLKKLQKDERVRKHKVKIQFLGRLNLLPEDIQILAADVMLKTSNHSEGIVNFCIAYGGKQEIIDAVQHLIKNNLPATEENIRKNLYLQSEPDLIIRTGGHTRTSNFLIWQAAYSEWIFLEKLWPEFSKEDLLDCIEKFKSMQRNFGK